MVVADGRLVRHRPAHEVALRMLNHNLTAMIQLSRGSKAWHDKMIGVKILLEFFREVHLTPEAKDKVLTILEEFKNICHDVILSDEIDHTIKAMRKRPAI